MAKILIAYTSWEGQTKAIAHHLAGRATAAGHAAALLDLRANPKQKPADLDAAILAGALRYGRHDGALARFAQDNAAALKARPTLFLSISLSAAGDDPNDLAGARRAMQDFLAKTGLEPQRAEMVAGGVHLKKTPWLQRQLLKLILKRKGVAVPPDGELDFTDWPALDALADEFLADLASAA